jgi:hypothetical protein
MRSSEYWYYLSGLIHVVEQYHRGETTPVVVTVCGIRPPASDSPIMAAGSVNSVQEMCVRFCRKCRATVDEAKGKRR